MQDFYPTPGTLSTCMYYTGLDPRTMASIYVARDPEEKRAQRALLQWRRPENRKTVLAALKKAGREDLIGYGPDCLVRPEKGAKSAPDGAQKSPKTPENAEKRTAKKPAYKAGWAKPKPKKNARPTGRGKKK